MYGSMHSLTLALDGGEWSASRSGRFTPRDRSTSIHWIGGWVGPRASVDCFCSQYSICCQPWIGEFYIIRWQNPNNSIYDYCYGRSFSEKVDSYLVGQKFSTLKEPKH